MHIENTKKFQNKPKIKSKNKSHVNTLKENDNKTYVDWDVLN